MHLGKEMTPRELEILGALRTFALKEFGMEHNGPLSNQTEI